MANTIKIKNSSVAANVPTAAQLEVAELALNTADKKLYSKDTGGTVFEIGGGASASKFETFTTSGTWTKPASGTFARITCVGSGGGGAADATSRNAGAGLGGDVVTAVFLLSALSATETVTVGAGGVGAASSSNNGSNGSPTSFGTRVVAAGGAGGLKNSLGNIAYTGTSSSIAAGGTAQLGQISSLFSAYGGDKASGATGPANGISNNVGTGGASSNSAAGSAGTGYGAGGGAGVTAGGAGRSGLVIVEIF